MTNEKQFRAASQARVRMFIQMARKYGLSELKVGEIEIKLAPVSTFKDLVDKTEKPIETEGEQMPSDEELLHWSDPHFDSLQAEKRVKAI